MIKNKRLIVSKINKNVEKQIINYNRIHSKFFIFNNNLSKSIIYQIKNNPNNKLINEFRTRVKFI